MGYNKFAWLIFQSKIDISTQMTTGRRGPTTMTARQTPLTSVGSLRREEIILKLICRLSILTGQLNSILLNCVTQGCVACLMDKQYHARFHSTRRTHVRSQALSPKERGEWQMKLRCCISTVRGADVWISVVAIFFMVIVTTLVF